MGRIIRLPGDTHREVQELLPWYVTGQIEPSDRVQVEAHLKTCAQCRTELGFQQRLASEIPQLPIDVEHGWSRMRERLEKDRAPRGLAWLRAGVGALGRSTGGAIAVPANWGGLALVALLAVGGTAVLLPMIGPARYHALGAAPPATTGNVVVIFRPDTPERDFRATLRIHHARLVDGPTTADAYVLQVPSANRMQILAQLRAQPDIVVAEAIDQPAAR